MTGKNSNIEAPKAMEEALTLTSRKVGVLPSITNAKKPLSGFCLKNDKKKESNKNCTENGDHNSSKANKIRGNKVNKVSVSNVHLGDVINMTVLGQEEWPAVYETCV